MISTVQPAALKRSYGMRNSESSKPDPSKQAIFAPAIISSWVELRGGSLRWRPRATTSRPAGGLLERLELLEQRGDELRNRGVDVHGAGDHRVRRLRGHRVDEEVD